MTLILRIFIYMKHLVTILFLFFTSFLYSQVIYNGSDFYETIKVKYDTLYKEDGNIKQIGKISYNLQGQKHGEWLIWDDNSQLRIQMFYENGVRKGKWKIYDQHGILINERDYIVSN